MFTEKQIEIAAKMYDARRTLKSLCPDTFAGHCQEWQDVVKKVMAANGLSELEAMIDMMKKLDGQAMSQMWLLAAVVEMLEPSEEFDQRIPLKMAEKR